MSLRRWFIATLALPLAAQAFTWQRQVNPSGRGPQRLDVDLALLAASRASLADLRLKDAAGVECPYVLVAPAKAEPPWLRGQPLPLPESKVASGVEVDLGSPVRTGRLRVEGLRAPFLKRFRLEGSGDRQRWTELVGSGSLFDLPAEGLRLLTVDFPDGEYRYLRLVWDDRTSARVPLPLSVSVQRRGPAAAVLLAPSDWQRRPSEPGVSRFKVSLPGPGLPLRALVLDVGGAGPLLRRTRVLESRLQAGALVPRALGAGLIKRAQHGDASASDLRIPLEAPLGTELELRVDDGNNPALALAGVQLELEPQPWIYFEARGDGPLTAFCGDARLARPRYDREALSQSLGSALTARAEWGPQLPLSPVAQAGALGLEMEPGALLDASGFKFHRAVPPGAPGLAALVMDAHVLSHSPRLADLRLVNGQGRQIPYLLEQSDEPLSLDLAVPQGRSQGHSTLYAIVLPQSGLPGAELVLETSSRVFQRRVRLREETPESGTRELATETWIHGDSGDPAPALVLPLPPTATPQLTLEVDEGDNQALPLRSARLLLPTWRLRYFQPEGPLTLCYGQELEAPSYDLALLAERFRNAPAREVTLAPEGAPGDTGQGRGLEKAFWAVLVVAVVALLAILARLIKG